jgi:hypothetical protein
VSITQRLQREVFAVPSVEELHREIESLKTRVEDHSRFEKRLKVAATLGAVVVFSAGLVQWWYTSQSEFRKRFWEEQLDVYQEASDAAAKIAMAETPQTEAAVADRSLFWRLYWGKLSILEGKGVKDAMVAYGNELSEVEKGTTRHPGMLKKLSYQLARACRESLKKTWEPVPVDDIDAKE